MDDKFTLEKLEISKRLHDVELTMTKFIEKFDAHTEQDRVMQERITKIVENHDKMLLGTNGHDGMKIHIDRLTQKEKWRTTMYGAIWVAICGLVTAAVWNILTRGA